MRAMRERVASKNGTRSLNRGIELPQVGNRSPASSHPFDETLEALRCVMTLNSSTYLSLDLGFEI